MYAATCAAWKWLQWMSYKAIVQLSGMVVTSVFTTGFVMIVNRDGI